MASQVSSETDSGPSASRRGGEAECTSIEGMAPVVGSTAFHPSVVERSTVTASARPPALTISSATAPLRAGSTSTQRTLAPSAASASAMARPMLEAEPVTMAVSPLNRPIGVMGYLVRKRARGRNPARFTPAA